MKKFIIGCLVFLLLSSFSFSQTWYTTNQATVAWDAVTQLVDGSAIPEGETVRYQIYILREGYPESAKISVGVTTNTQYTITLPEEGKWFIGIQSERVKNDEVISRSEISWSSNTAVCQGGNAFGVAWFRMPEKPKNLRIK